MWAPLVRPDSTSAMDVLDDGQIRGFASVGAAAATDAGIGHLFALYVRPDAWSTGIGSQLLTSALQHLASWGITAAELWVQEENNRARSFYERRLWTSTGQTRTNDRGTFIQYVVSL